MRAFMITLLLAVACLAGELEDMGDFIEVEVLPFMGFTAVGVVYTGDSAEEVMDTWLEFLQRVGEIPGVYAEEDAYGILLDFDPESGEFSYMAAVAAEDPDPIPEGMLRIDLEPGTYAVFTFPFHMLEDVYDFAYDEWLPSSGFVKGEGYDFEYYPEDFMPSEEGVLMQLYVSIQDEDL
mgnify:CR=1 FL=1